VPVLVSCCSDGGRVFQAAGAAALTKCSLVRGVS